MGRGLSIEFVVRLQFEPVNHQAQIGELGTRTLVDGAGFQAVRHAVETFAQRAVFLGVAEFPQQSSRLVRPPSGLFDQPQSGRERDPARFRVLEHAALENPALPRPMGVEPAGTIRTQRRTRLGKAGYRLGAA